MKIAVLVIGVTFLSSSGKTNVNEKWLTRNPWRIESVSSSDFLMETSLNSELAGMRLAFANDGSYVAHTRKGTRKGTWKLNQHGKIIELVEFCFDSQTFQIKRLRNNNLQLKLGDDSIFIIIQFQAG